ncbi:hypothetical protein JOF56_002534 [Kibdelosporangium banguiense]|uniref:Uncharacterized protein n=1 Tax=Kibdelosporangium banguiense TaxID=1365924 RepID=A0ABS4TDS8_9PSEU|nr:hypothetical protein [Kibdelosporangium banguiense]MBP2322149.1 hypothetical protein [Kibdelosporangium banguiense]
MKPVGPSRRRLLVAADAVGYGRWHDYQQLAIQRHMIDILDYAAAMSKLRRGTWERQAVGDGELAVLPEDEPEHIVVDTFIRQVDVALARHNTLLLPEARLRLRFAVHFGRIMPGDNGYAGPGPVEVSRMLNSAPLRRAIAEIPEANLALMVSGNIFKDTIEPLHTTLRPAEFYRVHVMEKEFEADAWLWIPGLPYLTASGIEDIAQLPQGQD